MRIENHVNSSYMYMCMYRVCTLKRLMIYLHLDNVCVYMLYHSAYVKLLHSLFSQYHNYLVLSTHSALECTRCTIKIISMQDLCQTSTFKHNTTPHIHTHTQKTLSHKNLHTILYDLTTSCVNFPQTHEN